MTTQREKNQQILLNWIEKEVNSRLQQSLSNRISILLRKEEDPLSVHLFGEMELISNVGQSEKVLSRTEIFTVYQRDDIKGRLLILGEPGSGKTTTLLQLAKQLLEVAKNDINQPIPILFNLSTWVHDRQSIHNWIIDCLKAPPYSIKKELIQQWLEAGIILPLLDGLDEVASDRQKLCITQINEYLVKGRAQLPLIVCSRSKVFKQNKIPLLLNRSIIIKPLREEQIKNYIERTEEKQLWKEIQKDSELLELCKVPFFLILVIICCQKIDFNKWINLASLEKKKDYLFETYITQMLERPYPRPKYNDIDTKNWLKWLAVQLREDSQTDFFIENLQPYCLESRGEKLMYEVIFGVIRGSIFGLTGGFASALILNLMAELINLLAFGFIFGLIIGLIVGFIQGLGVEECKDIKPVARIELSFWKNKYKLIKSLIWGLLGGLLAGLFLGLLASVARRRLRGMSLAARVSTGLIFGLLVGMIAILKETLPRAHIDPAISTNQGIKSSITNNVKFSFISSISILIVMGIVLICSYQFPTLITFDGLTIGNVIKASCILSMGMVLISIFFVEVSAIQHFNLRIVLFLLGYTPWNYAKFLDYATNRLFLQRVGGGYRFIHRMLQEHFVNQHG
ncbi:NACHT domain-containing protein [Crocosphaera sp.]|uniref:NACHT domain-containing protein n=1 Tax=Crocosphaera sp. TaxID=2729996 RepID=UPI003F21CAE8|nr:NACHT domain-containing protein [Crocosphaera sp.]